MNYLYFDESKHVRHGFILGAYVYSKRDLNDDISQIISSVGLRPETDEFKSSFYMSKHPEQKELRRKLQGLLHYIKIGLVISSENEYELRSTSLNGLKFLTEKNDEFKNGTIIFFDAGIFKNQFEGEKYSKEIGIDPIHNLYFEQNSKIIRGVQLADLVAHTCSIILLESLGVLKKTVKAGKNSGYEPNLDINIGFELWTTIRYNFFSDPPPHPDEWTSQLDYASKVTGKGLFISELCNENIKSESLKRFGEMYLGCIH